MKIRVLGKRGHSGGLEIIVVMLMIVGIAMLPALPWVLGVLLGIALHARYYISMTVLLEYSDVLALIMLWNGRKILRNINRRRPFIRENARKIQAMAACCGLLAVGYVTYGSLRLSYFSFIMALAFLLMCLILIISSELFRTAVEFKEENDLTI